MTLTPPVRVLACLALLACPSPDRPGDDACQGGPLGEDHSALAIATATPSFDGGTLTRLDLDSLETCAVTTVSPDSVVAVSGEQVIDIGRLNVDRVRMYAPPEWSEPTVEFSVGPGTNPQDVVRCGGAWWISQLEVAELRAFDDDGRRIRTVQLGKWADADGLPEAGSLLAADGRLQVALQRLDRDGDEGIWPPAGPGVVLTIDCDDGLVLSEREVVENPAITTAGDRTVAFGDSGIQAWAGDGETESLATLDHVASAAFITSGYGVAITRDPVSLWHQVHCTTPTGEVTDLLATASFLSDLVATDHGEVWIAARTGWANEADAPDGAVVEPAVDAQVWSVDPVACSVEQRIDLEQGPFSLDVY